MNIGDIVVYRKSTSPADVWYAKVEAINGSLINVGYNTQVTTTLHATGCAHQVPLTSAGKYCLENEDTGNGDGSIHF